MLGLLVHLLRSLLTRRLCGRLSHPLLHLLTLLVHLLRSLLTRRLCGRLPNALSLMRRNKQPTIHAFLRLIPVISLPQNPLLIDVGIPVT